MELNKKIDVIIKKRLLFHRNNYQIVYCIKIIFNSICVKKWICLFWKRNKYILIIKITYFHLFYKWTKKIDKNE